MPPRRAFFAAIAVVLVSVSRVASTHRQRREETLATVSLIIEGMT